VLEYACCSDELKILRWRRKERKKIEVDYNFIACLCTRIKKICERDKWTIH